MSRGALHQILKCLLIEHTAVDGTLIQLAERQERGQSHAPVSRAKGTVLKQREEKRRRLFGKSRVGVLAEDCRLRPLDGIEEAELRFDFSRMRVIATEFCRNRPMQLDQVLCREIPDARVSR